MFDGYGLRTLGFADSNCSINSVSCYACRVQTWVYLTRWIASSHALPFDCSTSQVRRRTSGASPSRSTGCGRSATLLADCPVSSGDLSLLRATSSMVSLLDATPSPLWLTLVAGVVCVLVFLLSLILL